MGVPCSFLPRNEHSGDLCRSRQAIRRVPPSTHIKPDHCCTENTLPPPPSPREEQRIAKLLARAGVASRRDIERMIADRRISIDGKPVETPATLLTSLRGVTVDGNPVQAAAPARLFRYHKPTGLLTAARDPKGRPTIYDKLPPGLPRVMPVGRLDMNTEGLLLLTTDGELKRQLELPSSAVERTYRARVFGDVSQEQLEQLIHGVEIEGIRYGAIDANLERRTGRNGWVEMRLTEGKNREVRRVLEYLGLQVSRLIRVAYGPFVLQDMPAGAVDEVRQHDLVMFRKTMKSPSPLVGEGKGEGRAASAAQETQRAPSKAPVAASSRARRSPSPNPLSRGGRA
ncbi:MAG TPA: pseudouridine synthase [Allosphingosinicella sp.]